MCFILSFFFSVSGLTTPQTPPLSVELTELYARDNAKEHHTERFELVLDNPPTAIFRRGCPFYFAIRFDRPFENNKDLLRLVFDFGKLTKFL